MLPKVETGKVLKDGSLCHLDEGDIPRKIICSEVTHAPRLCEKTTLLLQNA